jgi:DNA repair photolyase
MNVRPIFRQPILQTCSLGAYAWQIDPYIGCEHLCAYCYALNQAETDWEREILTYRDLVTQLAFELDGLEPQAIYMGWNTDPYQPAEKTHQQTRRVLELLASRGHWPCILTKSGLVGRDVDLLAALPGTSVGISLAFHEESVRRLFEANAPPNSERIEALKALKEAGIATYALICPVMPFITNTKRLVKQVADCANRIWVYGLNIETAQDRNWRNVQRILDRQFPDVVEQYRQILFSAGHPYWTDLRHELERLRAEGGLDLRIML